MATGEEVLEEVGRGHSSIAQQNNMKELDGRGHRFVRYADDCNIFVCSHAAGERVMQSMSKFIENSLQLKINKEKSKVCEVKESTFLGYTVLNNGIPAVSHPSIKRIKEKVKSINPRNRGVKFEQIISELNTGLRGRLNCFRLREMSQACPNP